MYEVKLEWERSLGRSSGCFCPSSSTSLLHRLIRRHVGLNAAAQSMSIFHGMEIKQSTCVGRNGGSMSVGDNFCLS